MAVRWQADLLSNLASVPAGCVSAAWADAVATLATSVNAPGPPPPYLRGLHPRPLTRHLLGRLIRLGSTPSCIRCSCALAAAPNYGGCRCTRLCNDVHGSSFKTSRPNSLTVVPLSEVWTLPRMTGSSQRALCSG